MNSPFCLVVEIWYLAEGTKLAPKDRKARAETLEPGEFEQFHRDFVELLEQHRQGDGVSVPAPYLVILGRRR